jgi:hypothetical protein
LKIPSAAAAVLVGFLLSAPAFAQALIHGTLTDTMTERSAFRPSIKFASDAGFSW